QSISGGKFLSLRELNQILLLEKGTGFEKYNKGNDSRLIFLFSYSYLCYNVLDCYSAKIKFRHS
ncbi:TPA: hypothetical protein ACGO5D_000354, partial [Streptococcus suis]